MLKYFVEKFKSLKADYLNISPREKWRFVLNIAIFCQNLTGVAMSDVNFKVWWYTYISGVAFLDLVFSVLYTLWFYAEQPLKSILFFSLLGILVPSVMMYVSVFDSSKRKELQSLLYFAGEKIYPGYRTECSHRHMEMCDQSAIKLLLDTIRTVLLILVATSILSIFSLISLFLMDEKQFPIPVLFPFTDLETPGGLTINLINQFFVGLIGLSGNIGMEIPTCMLNNSGSIITIKMSDEIDEFTNMLEQPVKHSEIEIDYCFRNILIQVQDFDRYVIRLNQFCYWRLLLQPILLSFGVSISLFFYLSGAWVSGLGAAMFSYIQLYMPCNCGYRAQSANDKLLAKLQEMPWLLLSKRNQLAYAHLLDRLQNGAVIRMGPFAVLNFETLSEMTRRIYSFLMMLLRMLE